MIHVAVAVIADGRGRILLSRRPEAAHQGGLWEFPGGKVEPNESLSRALEREIWEELGLRVTAHRPLIVIKHRYPDKSVLLDVHRVTAYIGAPEGRESQPLAWVAPDSLTDYPMPAADRPIVAAIRLPDACLITGSITHGYQEFLQRLEASLQTGIKLVQLRVLDFNAERLIRLVSLMLPICRSYGAKLLLNGDPDWVARSGADGVHLNSQRLMALETRPLGYDKWVSASCHNADELKQAQRLGLDFALLSPVLPTPSHPYTNPIGWAKFQILVNDASIPVFALGGMGRDHLAEAWRRGAQGVAGISSFWSSLGATSG